MAAMSPPFIVSFHPDAGIAEGQNSNSLSYIPTKARGYLESKSTAVFI